MKRNWIILTFLFLWSTMVGQVCNSYFVKYSDSTKTYVARFHFKIDSTFDYKVFGNNFYAEYKGTFKANKRIITLTNRPLVVVYPKSCDTIWMDTEKHNYTLKKIPLLYPVEYTKFLNRKNEIIPLFKGYNMNCFQRFLILTRLKKNNHSFIRVEEKLLDNKLLSESK